MSTQRWSSKKELVGDEWIPPDPKTLTLQFSIADSVLEDFVKGHNASAVLRELVQNEFDANGTKVEVLFGEDSVQILGGGTPVDASGRRRLSVMLGKGRVSGTGQEIRAKANGIGSKNFGLRSLFLFGDGIFIRSNGRQTFLDISGGTLLEWLGEPSSRGRPGIHIRVPYRTTANGELEPFHLEKENRAIQGFYHDLVPTLLRLARPKSTKTFRELVVSSERCDRRINWVQSATEFVTSAKNVVGIHRKIRVKDSSFNGESIHQRQTFEEIEFQKSFAIPQQLQGNDFPGYFRVPGIPRIKIGVSLKKRGRRVDPEHQGLFFYPIGVPNGYTGNAVSVNAPFAMDGDRSHIVNHSNSPWNAWLLECAASLTMQLLTSDWLKNFGPDAYLAVFPNKDVAPTGASYSAATEKELETGECWPSRERVSGRGKRIALKKAANLVIPETESLDGLLTDSRYLATSFMERSAIRDIVKRYGTKIFSINSLVRLRCCGKDSVEQLATKLKPEEASYWYQNFPKALNDVDRQEEYARALDSLSRKMSNQNRQDLRNIPTTLTAAGTLSAPSEPLWVVDPKVSFASMVPAENQLHPRLHRYKVIANLCRPFDMNQWVREVSLKAQSGSISEQEREALYRHILATGARFDPTTRSLVKNSPVLKDHNGNWVKPVLITDRGAIGANHLEPILHFAHEDYSNDSQMARSLGFRTKVTAEDLVNFAVYVEEHPASSHDFEQALSKLQNLLTRQTVSRLFHIPFIRNSLGGLSRPSETYLSTPLNKSCLGEEAPFVISSPSLYRRLGCLDAPRTEDILKHLHALRQTGSQPTDPIRLYAALVELLKSEGKRTNAHSDKEILWVRDRFYAPDHVIAGQRNVRALLGAVPQLPGSTSLRQSALSLGAHPQPQPHHWRALLLWIAGRHSDGNRPVSTEERESIREVYGRSPTVIDDIPSDSRVFLDREGFLHSSKEVLSGTYLIDDDPRLSEVLSEQGIHLAFADSGDGRSLEFYAHGGVKRLTEVREKVGVSLGEPLPTLPRLDVDNFLSKLHSREFASAVAALVEVISIAHPDSSRMSPLDLFSELKARASIAFVSELTTSYVVDGHTVFVPESVIVEEDRYVCAGVRKRSDLPDLFSWAISELITEDVQFRRALSDSIYRLLEASSPKRMERYLKSRGVPWTPPLEPLQGVEEAPDEVDEWTGDESDVVEYVLQKLSDDLTRQTADAADHSFDEEPDEEPIVVIPPIRSQPVEPILSATAVEALPPIDQVNPRSLPVSGSQFVGIRPSGTHRVGGSNSWTSPTPEQEERRRRIGRRGEEIIYNQEVAKVTALGYSASKVVWVSDRNPESDHDILSLDYDGRPVWIEVKATSGKDGRFRWSKAEFDLALKQRKQYILYRVYQADTSTPAIKCFRDPIGLVIKDALSLNVESLNAEVEAL